MQKYANIVDLVKSFPTRYSNEYLLAKIGVDTAENEPLKAWRRFNSLFIRLLRRERAAHPAGALGVARLIPSARLAATLAD